MYTCIYDIICDEQNESLKAFRRALSLLERYHKTDAVKDYEFKLRHHMGQLLKMMGKGKCYPQKTVFSIVKIHANL